MTALQQPPALPHPAPRALLAQLGAALLVLGLMLIAQQLFAYRPSLLGAGLLQGLLAALLGQRLGLLSWWLPINLLFVPEIGRAHV